MDISMVGQLSQMPQEMLAFTIDSAVQRSGARLGNLAVKNRAPIATPNYVTTTSRGVVPHLSHDNLSRHTKIKSMYFGLEDCTDYLTRTQHLADRH
jgi:queuine tRNA-ribosyltransferase